MGAFDFELLKHAQVSADARRTVLDAFCVVWNKGDCTFDTACHDQPGVIYRTGRFELQTKMRPFNQRRLN